MRRRAERAQSPTLPLASRNSVPATTRAADSTSGSSDPPASPGAVACSAYEASVHQVVALCHKNPPLSSSDLAAIQQLLAVDNRVVNQSIRWSDQSKCVLLLAHYAICIMSFAFLTLPLLAAMQ